MGMCLSVYCSCTAVLEGEAGNFGYPHTMFTWLGGPTHRFTMQQLVAELLDSDAWLTVHGCVSPHQRVGTAWADTEYS